MISNKSYKEIEGRLIFETDKAVRIKFKSGKERWIPKSTIVPNYDHVIMSTFFILNLEIMKSDYSLGD